MKCGWLVVAMSNRGGGQGMSGLGGSLGLSSGFPTTKACNSTVEVFTLWVCCKGEVRRSHQ